MKTKIISIDKEKVNIIIYKLNYYKFNYLLLIISDIIYK